MIISKKIGNSKKLVVHVFLHSNITLTAMFAGMETKLMHIGSEMELF